MPRFHFRARWPDSDVPDGEPLWFLYEVDTETDAVLRSVEVYPEGKITRNSVELEQRKGDVCPSLIDTSLVEGFKGIEKQDIAASEFEELWIRGVDTPFWFP